MTDVLVQPDTATLSVSRHPHHEFGDAVSIRYTDMQTGLPHVWVVPLEVAGVLSDALASIVESPAINARADQLRAEQRDQ